MQLGLDTRRKVGLNQKNCVGLVAFSMSYQGVGVRIFSLGEVEERNKGGDMQFDCHSMPLSMYKVHFLQAVYFKFYF